MTVQKMQLRTKKYSCAYKIVYWFKVRVNASTIFFLATSISTKTKCVSFLFTGWAYVKFYVHLAYLGHLIVYLLNFFCSSIIIINACLF